ncbi:hypothetical protein PSACC_03641 [Paramicrosporidium saccamoebae]|uniref:Uncharacterized protein n=1 Tax=Paramicrosporidium saccamoebae TaxID=1246581 RepID=A0A2H9TFI3_9FUNG|nr:hypothetical protein PSACC_03641 [Paramicrosporidium saccamoebae]
MKLFPIASVSPIALLVLASMWCVSNAKVFLDKVHAFNVQRISSTGLAGRTDAISLSNMGRSANHQVPKTLIEFTEDNARVEMSSGGIVVVMRDQKVIVPDPDELGCLQKHLPQLDLKTEFEAKEGDLVIFIHPLNRKWHVKPVDLTGTFSNQDFDVELLQGFLKYSKNFWDVAIVAGTVSTKSEEDRSKGSIVFVPPPKVSEKRGLNGLGALIIQELMRAQNRRGDGTTGDSTDHDSDGGRAPSFTIDLGTLGTG